MKRNFFYLCFVALLFVCNTSIFANTKAIDSVPLSYAPGIWFLSVGGGMQYPQWHKRMHASNTPELFETYDKDSYSTRKRSESVFVLSAGRRWQRDSDWFPSYSFEALWQHFFRTQLGKNITSYSDDEMNDYKYNWELTSNVVLATAKLNLVHYGRFAPYIQGGIGSSFNRTSNYKELALTKTTPRTNPKYSNFSTSEFAYLLGIGVDLQLNSKLSITVGYNFLDLGQISSGPGKEDWSNQSLTPGSYHSNEVLITITYLFGKQHPAYKEK
ncbi:MAG: outer membrane beta-barrel protein [Legionella sp.]|uniref:outer membrane protein n=1 Tax=Legionella sp. TaxID=459 RepID=UPI0039E5FB07